ncbi:ADP-ribosylglycohydrolase [Periconia macrospinosa]|uniref:ADP-ribosylglycohydrolase n=1 Tax=Periconia macrospinosa TaxID=97972 RepID=A0A2V1CZ10_9PLEO|nr:ADP-ribosylglycohydrolase [Periconia macrospinosa]
MELSPEQGQDPQDRPSDEQNKDPDTHELDFVKLHPFVRSTVVNKAYGCIVGSALGDTIGLYTEFLPKSTCLEAYKEMKFSLVENVTEAINDSHRKFAIRLRIWIEQGLRALDRPPCGIGALVGSVVTNPDYLAAPFSTAVTRWVKTARHVAPNGSLMRTHPIGIIGVGMSEEACWRLTADVGRTTHADPRCTVACCISVGLIRGLLRGEISREDDVNEAIERAYAWVFTQPDLINPGLDTELTEFEIKRHLERREFERHVYAKSYAELHLDNHKEMGYVYKCLGSAILALRLCIHGRSTPYTIAPPSKTVFEDVITELVLEGGDADTNAAAAGALIGAYLGYTNLPAHWTEGLAHKEWLQEKTMRFLKVVGIVEGYVKEVADEAPNGGKPLMDKNQLEKRDAEMLATILTRKKERDDRDREKKTKAKGLAAWFSKK